MFFLNFDRKERNLVDVMRKFEKSIFFKICMFFAFFELIKMIDLIRFFWNNSKFWNIDKIYRCYFDYFKIYYVFFDIIVNCVKKN